MLKTRNKKFTNITGKLCNFQGIVFKWTQIYREIFKFCISLLLSNEMWMFLMDVV